MTENPPHKFAIFDIDGTIFRSSLLIEIVEVLIEKGIFPKDTHKIYSEQKENWLNRKGEYHPYIMAVVKAFMDNIKGVRNEDYMDVADVVIKRYRFRTYKYTENLIKKLKDDGYFLLAISQSPKNILDLFCNELGFDKVYGRLYEVNEEGYFTGTIQDEDFISDKASVLHRAIEKQNLTLENSVGVGDTEGDISFLNIVERPICFNPNNNLWNYAKENNWEVVIERKDVVYELNK